MRQFLRLCPLLSLAILIGACDDVGRVTATTVDAAYDPDELGFAGEGGMTMLIHGNPGEAPKEAFAERLTSIFAEAHTGPDIRFTTEGGGRPLYRVILVFNAAAATTDAGLCRNDIPPSRPLDDEVSVRAAFCRGGTPLTGAIGVIDHEDSLDEATFRQFLLDVANTLFPIRGGNED